jgi:hypothetical protein
MKKFTMLMSSTICILGFTTSLYAANPVTKEYVDVQINSLQTQVTTIKNQITNINPGISYTAGSGISIAGNVISNTNPGVSYTAGSGISIANNVISDTSSPSFYIGQYYQGGVIFWLDASSIPPVHGLISDIADKGSLAWSTTLNSLTNATLNGAFQGQNSGTFNTAKILSVLGSVASAAHACGTSTSQGFSDWYLPSQSEAALMVENEALITMIALNHSGSGFSGENYWSSTESSSSTAFFDDGAAANKTIIANVRCIKAF